MKKYNFCRQSGWFTGLHGRHGPGKATDAAGYPWPVFKVPPAGAGRGQPPPGERVDIRGREPCGDALNVNGVALNPNAVRSATLTGFTTVANLNVQGRNEGMTDVMYMHDSPIRRRFQDLSACAAPDNVRVCIRRRFKDFSSNPNAVRSSIPIAIGTGFTTVANLNVQGRNEGMTNVMYMHNSRVRRRYKDLSACAASRYSGNNVWVKQKHLV